MGQQQFARFGRQGAAAITDQQVLVQLHLQQSHLTAQGRLRHIECDGGAGETAHLGHPHKVLQLFQVHGDDWE